jgi:hypothetical protein
MHDCAGAKHMRNQSIIACTDQVLLVQVRHCYCYCYELILCLMHHYVCITLHAIGYLLVNDDLQINYAQMNLQHDFNEKIWGTFEMSTKVPALEEEMQQFRKQGYHEWPWWDEFMEPTKAALADLHANYTHLMHTGAYLADTTDSFTRNYSDVYYVPAAYMQDYTQLLQVFTQHHVFLELAVPTALSMLVSKGQYIEQPLCQQAVLEPERSQFVWRADCKLTHPIKLSSAAEQQHAIDMLTQHCAAHRNTPLVPHIYP